MLLFIINNLILTAMINYNLLDSATTVQEVLKNYYDDILVALVFIFDAIFE
jgi:hypothetical protein